MVKESRSFELAWTDIREGLRAWEYWGILGWNDIRQKYRRSVVGPFWLSLSMGMHVGMLGMLFGYLFRMPVAEYLPFLTLGFLVWGFISNLVMEGTTVFPDNEGYIKNAPLPLTTFVLRTVWRNILMLAHHSVICVLLVILCDITISLSALESLVGLVVISVNGLWVGLSLGMLCVRFRDASPIIGSIMQALFFLSPILWKKEAIAEGAFQKILMLNPVVYFLDVVRSPLLGLQVDPKSWLVVAAVTLVGSLITFLCFAKYGPRIPYWL